MMARLISDVWLFSTCVLMLHLASSSSASVDEVSECPSGQEAQAGASLIQKTPRRHQVELLQTASSDVGAFGPATIPDKLLESMVMSNPYKCEFVGGEFDDRGKSCNKSMLEAGVHPANITAEGNQTAERFNALRIHMPIGSLPCCATKPFCAAPSCKSAALTEVEPAHCTKRSPSSNFAYMTHPDVWPAYHGNGGSFDLDVEKHWDLLGRINGLKPHLPPFDLAIDFGANTGALTEKLVMRRFAKDYIMVEANPKHKKVFLSRFGNSTFRKRFVSLQAASWKGAEELNPTFQYMNFAISDKPGGYLDTCAFNWDPDYVEDEDCKAEMASPDSLIPGRLSPNFVKRFKKAKSAYIKLDIEGMDQMALNGMESLLKEKRDKKYLVNFMMLEYCAPCMETVRNLNKFDKYDLKTLAKTLESLGFEAFIMGPRYLPLTHGSWDDSFVNFAKDKESTRCNSASYPKFMQLYPESFQNDGEDCVWPKPGQSVFTADIFAMRSSHPKAAEIKIALGACAESEDFRPSNY